MSDLTTEDTSELAKQLFRTGGFGHEDTWRSSPKEYREGWHMVAKFVQRMVIKRAISAVGSVPTGTFDSTPYRDAIMRNLTAELARLENYGT